MLGSHGPLDYRTLRQGQVRLAVYVQWTLSVVRGVPDDFDGLVHARDDGVSLSGADAGGGDGRRPLVKARHSGVVVF